MGLALDPSSPEAGDRRRPAKRSAVSTDARPAAPTVRILANARAAGIQAVVAGIVALMLWLASAAAQGFHFSPDSMSYASLARGFSSGHPFTGGILWLSAQPGRLQSIWPPFYPALIALMHALGPTQPWSEFLISGATTAIASAFAILAVHRAAGRCPWFAVPLVGGSSVMLYVADHGWTEPVCLALLGIHYWLAAEALRTESGGRAAPAWLLFTQGLAAGLAFLDRYAAAPFLLTALMLPAVLPLVFRWHQGELRGRFVLNMAAATLGVAVPVVPWTAAALALTGHLGAPYLPVGAGLHGAIAMARSALQIAVRETLTSTDAPSAAAHAADLRILLATVLCALAALALSRVFRLPSRLASGALRPAAVLLAVLAVDATLYTVVLVYLRAHEYFDAIGLRLIAPGLYPAVLLGLLLIACVPWRLVREALVLPLGLVILWHGGQAAAAGLRHPRIQASLSGPWCTPGPRGDCGLFSWLQGHTTAKDLIITNAGYTINFQMGRTVRQVAAYPYNPKPTAADFQRWSAEWLALHPGGRVLVALDADAGPVASPSEPYGALFTRLWTGDPTAIGADLMAMPATSGPTYRVFTLSAG